MLSFLLFDNIMADVASKQQAKGLFLSTIVKSKIRHTEMTKKKLTNLMGNLCCAREHSVFRVDFLHS
jgi:aconitase B